VDGQDHLIEQDSWHSRLVAAAAAIIGEHLAEVGAAADELADLLRGASDGDYDDVWNAEAELGGAMTDVRLAVEAAHANGVEGGPCIDATFALAGAEGQRRQARQWLNRRPPAQVVPLRRPAVAVAAHVHRRPARRRGAGRPAARRTVRTRGGDGGDGGDPADTSDGEADPAGVGAALAGARRVPA
jgi:hypothetical protein